MSVSDTYLVQIEVFQASMVGTVEHYHDEYNFCLGETTVTVIFTFLVFAGFFQSPAVEHRVKNFAEIICHYKNFGNFVLGEHSDKSIWLN